jgi:hypothetical protein
MYKPTTRFEKVREKSVVFPESSADKIVYISNSEGIGFRR